MTDLRHRLFSRRWTALLLLSVFLFLFFIATSTTLHSSSSSNYLKLSWLSTSPRLTDPVPIIQREKMYEAALSPLTRIKSKSSGAGADTWTYHPSCPSVMNIKLRYTDFYSYIRTTGSTLGAITTPGASTSGLTIYLALRIENPEVYISAFTYEITALVLYVGSHRFFVHVVFGGTGHDDHPGLVDSLNATLDELRVAYKITFEPKSTSKKPSYTTTRANLKNLLMEPFYTGDAMRQLGITSFEHVVFIEDAVFCAEDVLELLHEHKFQKSHLTCALDWKGGLIHDKWTIRTLTGKPPYMQSELSPFFHPASSESGSGPKLPQPFFTDPEARKRYHLLRSFPVFSCWSSIVIVDSTVFMPVDVDHDPSSGVSRKAKVQGEVGVGVEQTQPEPETSASTGLKFRAPSDKDKYSDTFLFCVDMWARNMFKVIMVPRASIGSTYEMYDSVRQDGHRKVKHPAGLEPEGKTLISYFRWTEEPPAEMVYHDYSLWDKNERIGNWNESLVPVN